MRTHSPLHKKTAPAVPIVCSLLFGIFSITYLAVFQKDLMSVAYYEKWGMNAPFFSWLGAFVLTALLGGLQWGSNLFSHFEGKLYFVSYFFPFLLLGVLTGVSPTALGLPDNPSYIVSGTSTDISSTVLGLSAGSSSVVSGTSTDVSSTVWKSGWKNIFSFSPWLMAFGILVYFILVKYQQKTIHMQNSPPLQVVNSNILGMVILCLFAGSIGNSDEGFHHELAMREAMKKKDYQEILEIGAESLIANKKMTEYRMIALTRLNLLGEKLFEYPQYYGSEVIPAHEPAIFKTILKNEEQAKIAFDCQVAALLLDKKLDAFFEDKNRLKEFYPNRLPRYYEEALLLCEYFRSISQDLSHGNASDGNAFDGNAFDGNASDENASNGNAFGGNAFDKDISNKTFGDSLNGKGNLNENMLSSANTLVKQRFKDFLNYRSQLQKQKKFLIEKNMLRKEYGDTYWWYYLYQ